MEIGLHIGYTSWKTPTLSGYVNGWRLLPFTAPRQPCLITGSADRDHFTISATVVRRERLSIVLCNTAPANIRFPWTMWPMTRPSHSRCLSSQQMMHKHLAFAVIWHSSGACKRTNDSSLINSKVSINQVILHLNNTIARHIQGYTVV